MTVVRLINLSKYYPNNIQAVQDFSLTIKQGERLALLGPSGCGKTTLLRMIAGLTQPDRGDILFDGESILQLPPQKRGAVMIFQQHQLFPFMSVADNIAFGLKVQRLDRRCIVRKIDEALEMVQLGGYHKRIPDQLSGGERQRVALARALILKPKILLLDESLSSLDAALKKELRLVIRQLQREANITTIFVTHDQDEAVHIADRIALMMAGRLKQVDQPLHFYERPADRQVAQFFGGVNFLPAKKVGAQVQTPIGLLDINPSLSDGDRIATIRPEAIQIGTKGHNNILVRVQSFSYGKLLTQCPQQQTFLQITPPPYSTFQPDEEIMIHIPKYSIWLLPVS